MWSDNESTVDLLGFQHLVSAVTSIIKNESLLPATIGIYGDWGSGKSSLVRMVESSLAAEEDVIVLSFNGWLFEGYEDAKTALMGTVLEELLDHQTFIRKAGEGAKKLAKKLLRRVNLFKAIWGLGKLGLAAHTGGMSAMLMGGSGLADVGTAAKNVRRQIRGSTESGYGSIINKQLVPRLGAIAVSVLRFDHIDAAVSGMIEDELSSKTIHNTVTLLRTMLAGKRGPSALRRGFAFHDPTLGLELPPLESRQITPPTPEQVWALIGAAKELGGLGYALAYTGAFTGVRRNEALGLRFNDIEWFGNEVNVRHAISKRRGTDGAHKWEWHVGPPKSRKSLRRIAATESVMKMLADLKVGKPDDAFIFPGDCSGFIDPDKFDAEVWKPIAEKAGMAGTRFHDLRHFFASQLIAQGETAAYVRDQMGHSSIKVTFDTYGHLFPGRGKEASARYEKSMADAKVRHKAEASVSNPLAIDGGKGPEGTVTN